MSNYEIARQIKPIRAETLERLFLKLRTNYQTISSLSIKYNDIADYYTFEERLNTIGIKNINFYDFYRDKEKYHHWIKNILQYYRDKKNKTPDVRIYKNIFNLYFGSITNFSIPNVLQVLEKYKPTRILDPTCGFGNRMVGCCALDVETYIGIDNNKNLELPLNELRKLLTKKSKTQVEIIIEDCKWIIRNINMIAYLLHFHITIQKFMETRNNSRQNKNGINISTNQLSRELINIWKLMVCLS